MPRTDIETFEYLIEAAAIDGPHSKAYVPLDLARRLLERLKLCEKKPRLALDNSRQRPGG